MTVTELLDAHDLARTYDHPSCADPWEVVEDYQRVLEYTGRRPNAGSQRVASALALPRSRIRPWTDGAIPDCVHAIQTAESKGWVPLDETSDVFEPLNRLVAWGLAAGTIKPETYAVYFRARADDERTSLTHWLDEVGLDVATHRDDERTTELRPREGGSVFGRVLWLLGVPHDDETADTTPQYLNDVSETIRRAFAETYLRARGEYWEFADRWIVEHGNRSEYYRRSLATLFRTLGADVDVHEDTVSIDDDFATDLVA